MQATAACLLPLPFPNPAKPHPAGTYRPPCPQPTKPASPHRTARSALHCLVPRALLLLALALAAHTPLFCLSVHACESLHAPSVQHNNTGCHNRPAGCKGSAALAKSGASTGTRSRREHSRQQESERKEHVRLKRHYRSDEQGRKKTGKLRLLGSALLGSAAAELVAASASCQRLWRCAFHAVVPAPAAGGQWLGGGGGVWVGGGWGGWGGVGWGGGGGSCP